MNQAMEYQLSFRCVALFNAWLHNEQSVQVSDTTRMPRSTKAGNQKKSKQFSKKIKIL